MAFRTAQPLRLDGPLELPPETAFTGSVVEAKRPGGFGKSGTLKVKVEGIELSPGQSAPVVARLDSQDVNAKGRLTTDKRRATDLYSLALYTIEGTLIGSQIKGGKGAAVGAGAGALAALIIAMSHRGQDVYLEPGMPFDVILEQPVELPGKAVWEAQQDYAQAHPAAARNARESEGGFVREGNSNSGSGSSGTDSNSGRPKLKRRPPPPPPQP